MEIFQGLEPILTVMSEFLYKKAFDKNRKLLKRLPYLIIYVLVLLIFILGFAYLGIVSIKNKQRFFGCLLIITAFFFLFLLIFSFIEKKKR